MATVILGGLLTSTLLNLFVLPGLYLRFGRRRSGPAGAVSADGPDQSNNALQIIRKKGPHYRNALAGNASSSSVQERLEEHQKTGAILASQLAFPARRMWQQPYSGLPGK
jgi:hypothetical protein